MAGSNDETGADKAQERPWSHLPLPALAVVMQKTSLRDKHQVIPLVCKAWRSAAVGSVHSINIQLKASNASKAWSLALWLRNHGPAFVKVMWINTARTGSPGTSLTALFVEFITAIKEGLAAAASQQQLPALNLEQFVCNLPDAASLLKFINPSTLNSLMLSSIDKYTEACSPSEAAAAICCLSSLRRLGLDTAAAQGGKTGAIPAEVIMACSQLTRLEDLRLMGSFDAAALGKLPPQLLQLTLWQQHPHPDPPPLDIGHLQQLQSFKYAPLRLGRELAALRKLPNLHSINLEFDSYTHRMATMMVPDEHRIYVDFPGEGSCWIAPTLPHLTSLCVIRGSGPEVLQALPTSTQSTLRSLCLTGSGLGSDSLPLLARYTKLEDLDLSVNTFDQLEALTSLSRLRRLNLSSTRVKPEAVAPLTKLSRLRALNLMFTRVPEAAVASLKEAVPGLAVCASLVIDQDSDDMSDSDGEEGPELESGSEGVY